MIINLNISRWMRWLSWIGVLLLLCISLISAVIKQSSEKIQAIAIEIEGNKLLSKSEVINLFKKNFGTKYADKTIRQAELRAIEEKLEKDVYIKSVDAYLDRDDKIHLNIVECTPLFRLIYGNNTEHYIDDEGQKIPIQNNRGIRIPVITVDENMKTKVPINGLLDLVKLTTADSFMNALVEQVHVEKPDKVWIIPKIGKEKICLGPLENLPDKIEKLKIFYKKGIKAKGWNWYKEIDLSFKDQIVCTEK